MTDARVLLERHVPRLVYDSLEAYFADAASIWTDAPSHVLRRADGTVLARPRPGAGEAKLSLAYLGAHAYADGRPVLASDAIGDTTRTYAANAAALHRQGAYANRVHGHAVRDRAGHLWLQYWLFYYYNDFRLLGPLLTGGKHEGDWELVQVRLNASEQPEQVVGSQHRAGESRAWRDVRTAGAAPLIYVARGSHANYFRPGSHWTGVWWDQADGRGPSITPALDVLDPPPGWAAWPGWWGDTKATASPLDANSPRGPAAHATWRDPGVLGAASVPARAAAPRSAVPPAPSISARRAGDAVVVAYDARQTPGTLVVGLRLKGSDAPATTHALHVDAAAGELALPVDGRAYDVVVSAAAPGGSPSPAAAAALPPGG